MAEPQYNPSKQRGFYAPFWRPFPVNDVPAHQPDEEPKVALCFNEDYLPYVQGALKALASELTFEGPRSCVQSWVQAMTDLLLLDPIECGGGLVSIPVGSIFPYGGSAAPSGYLVCDGSLQSREIYAALFTVIGETYGAGDGLTTFNLPDLVGRVPIGAGEADSGSVFNRGNKAGEETHTLTVPELPSHVHLFPSNQGGLFPGSAAIQLANAQTNTSNVSATGSGVAHNNMQPYQVVVYIIYAGV